MPSIRIASNSRSVPSASAFAVYSAVSNDTRTCDCADLDQVGLLDYADQVRRVGQIAVVQEWARTALMGILVEMVDAAAIARRRAALHAVHDVSLGKQQLGQKRAVLPCDASNESDLVRHGVILANARARRAKKEE